MVTTDISQLVGECASWITTLRSKRARFTTLRDKLQQLSTNLQDRETLKDLEHLQNQFYIQQINIHDLKHAIKEHEQIARWEKEKKGQVSDATISAHEEILVQYEQLNDTLDHVEDEFHQFVRKIE